MRGRPGARRLPPAVLAAAALLALLALLAGAPATLAGPTVPELVEVADIENLAASPDGRLVAFRVQRPSIERNSYAIEWRVADLAAGRTVRIAGGGDPIYGDAGPLEMEPPIWSPDGRFLYYRALVDGAIGIWRAAADGSGSRPIVVGDADVERLETSADGQALLYRTGPARDAIARAERSEYDEGILVDESVDLSQNLFRGAFVNGRLASQRLIGRWYQRSGLLWKAPRLQHRLDLPSLREPEPEPVPAPPVTPLVPTPNLFRLSARSVAGDAATLDDPGEAPRLEVRRAATGQIVRCGAAPCRTGRIVALAWRPEHDQILFTAQDRFYRQSLYLWDVAGGRVRLAARGDGLLGGGRDPFQPCALTPGFAVCVTAGAVSPPRLERIALERGARALLLDPNEALRGRAMPRVEQLSWKLADGRSATGTILTPAGAGGRAPLFVHHYQCPGYLRGGTGDEFPFAPMVDAGFVVACLNMVPFDEPRDGLGRYSAALASVERLVDLLAARGLIDRGRVGMGGFSAGSEATMWVAINSKLLSAAAIASAQYDPSTYWTQAVRGRNFAQVMRDFLQLGAPEETPERWKLIAPSLNVSRIAAPLLMQLPEQEARMASELHGRLTNGTTPVEMYAFPDEGHVKIQPRHRHAVYRRNLDWFRYWLQDHVDPDPARAEQYRRWEALRLRRAGSAAK